MTDVRTELHTYDDPAEALGDFCKPFLGPERIPHFATHVTADNLPSTIRKLLVHNDHMTDTLRQHHGRDIELNVLNHRQDGDFYQRHITLTLAGSNRIVEVGLVRIDLRYTTDDVRAAILERKTPLGDLLIGANVLRRIEPRWYFRFGGGCPILADFHNPDVRVAYGRLGTIYCDEAPAIELLEVVTDER